MDLERAYGCIWISTFDRYLLRLWRLVNYKDTHHKVTVAQNGHYTGLP